MLAYAAATPRPASRAGSPKALTLILAGHAVLIAAVMTARMEMVPGFKPDPIDLIRVPTPPPPPPPDDSQPPPQPQTQSLTTIVQDPVIDRLPPVIDMGQDRPIEVATRPTLPPIGGTGGGVALDPPVHDPVKFGPRFATRGDAIKPPYPLDKMRGEEEATLKLRLTIDADGRVTAVDPVGFADPSFLAAARRHIIRAWRYKPATEDGVAVPSSTVISLSFRMEDA